MQLGFKKHLRTLPRMSHQMSFKILFSGEVFVAKFAFESFRFVLSHLVLEENVPLLESGATVVASVTSNAVNFLKNRSL